MTKEKKGSSYLFMGVSSCGKSSIGAEVAKRLSAKFIDGDDLHPKANILKMKAGQPLNDDDRTPWLERINDAAFSIEMKSEQGVIVCSALKRRYRDCIRHGNQNVTFVHLHGEFELVKQRMLERDDHFMPVELLKSQFETLEMPDAAEQDVITISVDGSFDDVVERCVTAIQAQQ